MIDKFPLISVERYQTCSILMLSVISALHHVPLFMDRIWLLLVPVETEVDLQLLQTRYVVIQLAMNRSRRVSVVLTLMAILLTWRISVLARFFCFGKFLVGCG